jgi:hypothetical protein
MDGPPQQLHAELTGADAAVPIRRQQLQCFEGECASDDNDDSNQCVSGVRQNKCKSHQREPCKMLELGAGKYRRSPIGDSVAKAMKASASQAAARDSRWIMARC